MGEFIETIKSGTAIKQGQEKLLRDGCSQANVLNEGYFMKKIVCFTLILGLFFTASVHAIPSTAKTAIEEAAKGGQYLLLTFYETEDSSFTALSSVIDTFKNSSTKKFDFFNAQLSEPVNQEIAGKYGIQGTGNLPMLLVVAPNGAITGGFPKAVTPEQLKKSVNVSDLMLKTLKILQEQKVALVALQNDSTKYNTESWQAVSDFADDSQFKQFVGTVKADPSVEESQEFIKQCRLAEKITEATIVVLLPPGKIGKIITGMTSKADILAALKTCTTGCAPGGCSDRRFKKNVTPIGSALEKVSRLQGVYYTWDRDAFPDRDFPEGNQIGLIAQDVERVIPEVVHTDIESYKSIEYDKIVAVLIESIKEMKQQMSEQESLIADQQARIKILEEKR